MENIEKVTMERTKRGISVCKCCAACSQLTLNDKNQRVCSLIDQVVNWQFCCENWQLRESLEKAGDLRGRIKRPEYVMFITEIRVRENEEMENNLMMEEEAATVEEIRQQFSELTGLSPFWDNY